MGKKGKRRKHSILSQQVIQITLENKSKLMLEKNGAATAKEFSDALNDLGYPKSQHKDIAKKSIEKELLKVSSDANLHNITLRQNCTDVLKDFDVSGFLKRKWQHKMFVLKPQDYLDIQRANKNPVFMEQYNYSKPLYTFSNNIKFGNRNYTSDDKVQDFNDAQFYVSDDEKMLFAKIVNLSFKLLDEDFLKNYKTLYPSKQDQEKLIFMPDIYDKTLSISMYVMLDGDPKNTHSFLRYDSVAENKPSHKNIYIGGDDRQQILGEYADSPHIHFQNEDDNIICAKLYKTGSNDADEKWKTGRCNAIDVKHLINYLTILDSTPDAQIREDYAKGLHYNMPFLEAKYNKKILDIKSVNKLVNNYKKDKEDNHQFITKLVKNFELLNPKQEPSEKSFTGLINALKFVQFVYDERSNTTNLDELQVLSDLEIVCANEVMNCISKSRERIIQKDYKPKYSIKGDYLEKKSKKQKENSTNKEISSGGIE